MSIRKSKRAQGFTLIELGIVVAVIAVLVTVVLMGRGFLESTRTSKLQEAVNVCQKSAATVVGLRGGKDTVAANQISELRTRELIPQNSTSITGGTANNWVISNGFIINDIRWAALGTTNDMVFAASVTAPTVPLMVDIYRAAKANPNFYGTATNIGGMPTACAASTADPTTATAVICFNM